MQAFAHGELAVQILKLVIVDALLVKVMNGSLAIVHTVHHDVAPILNGETNIDSLGQRGWESRVRDGLGPHGRGGPCGWG